MEWVIQNWDEIVKTIGLMVAAASIIVRLTPSLRDDNILLPIIKILGKYVALDRDSGKDKEFRKNNLSNKKYGVLQTERPK